MCQIRLNCNNYKCTTTNNVHYLKFCKKKKKIQPGGDSSDEDSDLEEESNVLSGSGEECENSSEGPNNDTPHGQAAGSRRQRVRNRTIFRLNWEAYEYLDPFESNCYLNINDLVAFLSTQMTLNQWITLPSSFQMKHLTS